MTLRYAAFAAVSTDAQAAPDKVSISVQLQKAKDIAQSKGWLETAGPYIVPGESRTRFGSLRDAEDHIPQLKELLNAASRHDFDLLIVYDLNRFRSLIRQIFDVLCDYNTQLYILTNPRDPVPPNKYDEDVRSAVGMIVDMSGIISHNEINNIRRHYREKMPTRITVQGLHAGTGKPPYGYIKPINDKYNSHAILVPNPLTAPIVTQIKDAYLSGQSLTAIAKHLNDTHIPSPDNSHWRVYTVRYILNNPYYAGIVQWGKTKSQRDRRTGKVKRDKVTPTISQGKHTPLWDESTHQQIQAQLKLRGNAHAGWRTMQLSRLLYCPCGKVMHIRYAQFYAAKNDKYWKCSTGLPGHLTLVNSRIYPLVVKAVIHALSNVQDIKLESPQDKRPALKSQLTELDHRKQRWIDAFETGAIDARDYAERVASLTAQADTVREQLTTLEQQIAQNQTKRQQLNQLSQAIASLEPYFQTAPPNQINTQLRTLITRIEVIDGTPIIIWS